jgi:D-beta-D-heptose 7-phosphate kinase/D-beta-D-heptose 1-phosphate adenosyltransferase
LGLVLLATDTPKRLPGDSLNLISDMLGKFENCHIAVVGDLMLDEYIWGEVRRISPEAPVPVLNLIRREHTLGGAGNVVKNLRSLGAEVSVFGAVGEDAVGDQIVGMLDKLNVHREGVVRDPKRTSTRKSRLMAAEHGQQVFRLDEESIDSIDSYIEDHLLHCFNHRIREIDAILCSDYLKGTLTSRLLQSIFEAARSYSLPVIVGPKDSTPEKYEGAAVLVPNLRELAQFVKTAPDGDAWLSQAAENVIHTLRIESLLVTRGAQGMSLFERLGKGVRRVNIPTAARAVYDVTGAGDTVLSVFALVVALGANHEIAARWANVAGGIVVGKRGTACVTPAEIQNVVRADESLWPELARIAGSGNVLR